MSADEVTMLALLVASGVGIGILLAILAELYLCSRPPRKKEDSDECH